MNKQLLLILFHLIFCNTVKIITYDKPGNYLLSSPDYENALSFIIELWSAGAAGTTCGGGSGAFARINITSQNESFNLTIGKGGIGCVFNTPQFTGMICNNGTSSSINNHRINITLEGGGIMNRCSQGKNSNEGKVIAQNCYSYNNCTSLNIINGNPGKNVFGCTYCNVCPYWSTINCVVTGTGNGGNTPYGGVGGCLSSCDYFRDWSCGSGGINGTNGNIPGGGGGAIVCNSACGNNNSLSGYYSGSGGDGLAILYYEPSILISSTSTIRPTISPKSSIIQSITSSISSSIFPSISPSMSSIF